MARKKSRAPIALVTEPSADLVFERRSKEALLLDADALKNAIFNSANFSSIATDAKGVIQIFNVGAERMLGYMAADVMNKITPADISDPQEVIARAKALSVELRTPITPGFEALVFKASRGIEDIYELTYIRKDGSRFPAVVSVTALRDAQENIIGYLLIGTDNTARKQAEEALLKEGALQRAIFNSANFSYIATDAKGVIQIFNVGAERMLGYTAAEVMNKITPADISDPQEVIARAKALSVELSTTITPGFEALVFKASRGIEDIYELTKVRKDGSRFPAVVSITALRDDQGGVIGYLLIGTDNTARKQITEALRESEDLFSKAFWLNPDCMSIVRMADRTVIKANQALCRLWGNTPEEIIGKPAQEYSTWLNEEERLAFVQTLQEKGEYLNYETTLRLHDGRLVWFNISSRTITLNGEACVLSVLSDITERRRAVEEVRVSEERFQALEQNSWDAVHLLSTEGIILYESPSVVRVLGYEPEELVGRNSFELVHPDDVPRVGELFGPLTTTPGLTLTAEVRVRHKDGSWPWMDCVATNLLEHPAVRAIAVNYRDITERKRAEAESILLAAIVGSSDDAIIGKNLNSIITSWNKGAERLFGYTASEMVGTSITRLIPADRPDEENQILGKLKRGEKIEHFETLRQTKDGRLVDVSIAVSAIKDAAGNIVGASKVARDITARKQAEAALHDSEERFRTMANSMLQLAWIARADGYIFWYNRRWYEYTGTTPEQMEGWDWQSVHDPVVLPKVMEKWTGAIDAGTPFDMEFPLRGADGRFRTFLTRVQPLKDSAGRVVQWFGTNTDVEALKQAEQAIRQSEEYFRFLNDLVEATRTLADPEQIMAVMARMLGEHLHASRCAYADVEQDGEQFTILHDYTDGCASTVGRYKLSLFGARAVATLHRGETLIIRNVEAELLPGDGADMFNAIGIQAIITCPLVKEGGLRAMMAVHQTKPRDWKAGEIAIVQDVVERCWATIERRTAEETIQQLNVQLEQRVIERTAQLETANKELEAFSYSVSHDLRAPLRSIDGFSRILMKDFAAKLDEDGQDSFRRICAATQRMGQLIDDLLELSRVTRAELRRDRVDLSAMARAVVEDLRRHEPGRSAEFVVAEGLVADGDAHLLRVVIDNLLGNAWKFTGKRAHARIEFGAAQQDGQTNYFVSDDGAGFDPAHADKLFGTFQRLHSTTDFPGTGVGLATVGRIVHRHGGRAWADGNVNQGATFHFNLGAQNRGTL